MKCFRNIFNPGNIKGVEKPKNSAGKQFCLKLHTLDFCFKEYKFAHGTLNNDDLTSMKKSVKSAREGSAEYKNRRGNITNNEGNDNNTKKTRPKLYLVDLTTID